MAEDAAPLDWQVLLKGKCLLPARIQALGEALRVRCNAARIPGSRPAPGAAGGNVDRARLSRSIDAPGLAALLRGLDPVKQSTEDKVQAVVNVLPPILEDLSLALCTGGVHSALTELYLSCSWEWELHSLTVQALRLLLEGCTATPFGLEPFEQQSLVELAEALTDHLKDALEAGVEPKYAAGLDHALEGLFCITRYRGHPGAEAAKQRCWELDLPDALLELARVPESAHGERDPAEDWGPGTSFFINCALNCQRLLHNMAQSDGPLPEALLRFGDLLRDQRAFESLRCVLQVGVDMLCGRRFEAFLANTSQTGAAIVRNIFSIVGYGAYWLPADALLAWKDAGWEPLLRDIAGAAAVPGDNEDEALVFTMKLMDLTVHMSVPNTSPAALEQSRPRDLSPLIVNDLRQAVHQIPGPDGPWTIYQTALTTRTYKKRCGHCNKKESELAAAAAAAAAGSSSGDGAAADPPPVLRLCSGCRRVFYCSKECQTSGWKAHKQACKLYRLEQQGS